MPKYHSVGYISSLWHFCCLNQTKGGLAPSSQLRNVALSSATSHCARSCKVKSFEVEVCFTWSFCGAEIMVQQKMAGSNEFHGSTNQNEIESTDLKVIWRFNILNHIPNIVCRWCSFFWLKEKKHFQVHIRPSFPMNPGNRVSWVSIRVFVWKCRKLGKKKTKSNALKLKFPVEMALSWGNFPDGNFLQINFPDGFLHHDQLNQWWKAVVSQKRFLVPWVPWATCRRKPGMFHKKDLGM